MVRRGSGGRSILSRRRGISVRLGLIRPTGSCSSQEDVPGDDLGWLSDAVDAGFAVACVSYGRRSDRETLSLAVLEPFIDASKRFMYCALGVAVIPVLERAHRLDRLSIEAVPKDAADLSNLTVAADVAGSRVAAPRNRCPQPAADQSDLRRALCPHDR